MARNGLLAALALLIGAAPAAAADISTKDPSSPFLSGGQSWNGAYVEIGVGPGFVKTSLAGLVNLNEKGLEGTLRAGYDYRFPNSRLAIGLYGEVGNAFDVNGSNLGGFLKLGNQWQYGLGGKLSYDHGSGQIYGILGAAWEGFSLNTPIGSTNPTSTGIKYGVGTNVKVYGPVYLGIELSQTDWGSFTATPLHFKATNTDDAVRIFIGSTF
jgi:hypothetical protein